MPIDYTPAAAQALAQARNWIGRTGYSGHCLSFVRSMWGAAGMGGTANNAWDRAAASGNTVTDGSLPPIGAPVFFYDSSGKAGAVGHVAIVSKYVNGKPYIITTDYPRKGSIGEVPMDQLESAWGNLHYVGWSKSINNKTLTLSASPPRGANGDPLTATDSSGNQDVWDQIQEKFGLTDALLNMDKTDPRKGFTLREAFDAIRTGAGYGGAPITDPTRAANILARTDWFKTHGVDVTKRLVQEATNSGEFKQQVQMSVAQIKDSLASIGIKLSSTDLNNLARDSYVYGMNSSQIIDSAMNRGSSAASGGGTVGAQLDALNSLAYQNGVKVSAPDQNAWFRDLASGNKTQSDYEHMIRTNAAQTYSVFADQIKGGTNLMDIVRPYTQKAAALLEIPESQVNLDDPLFKDGKAFTTTDPKTGQPTVKPLWEFQKDIQSDARWQYTNNAKQQAGDFALNVLKRFGMVG